MRKEEEQVEVDFALLGSLLLREMQAHGWIPYLDSDLDFSFFLSVDEMRT